MTPGSGRSAGGTDRLLTPVFLDFPYDSDGKESAYNAGDPSLIPELGRSPGEGKGYPLQHSGLENSRDCIVHGVTRSLNERLSLPNKNYYLCPFLNLVYYNSKEYLYSFKIKLSDLKLI